jgi:hypothetical protein
MSETQITPDQTPPQPVAKFLGSTGLSYEVVSKPGFSDGKSGMMLDFVVADGQGKEAFVTSKNPREQAFASSLGSFLASKDPALSRLHFPGIKTEEFNGKPIALVDFFDDHHLKFGKEADKLAQDLTQPERDFLTVFNVFVGNWDFKAEHVLMPKGPEGKVGLIDFEKSFDFSNPNRLQETKRKTPTIGAHTPEGVNHFVRMLEDLSPQDWAEVQALSQQSGFSPQEASQLIGQLSSRVAQVSEEISSLKAL